MQQPGAVAPPIILEWMMLPESIPLTFSYLDYASLAH